MAPDCNFNMRGLANNTIQEVFVTNFITFTFLILCLVPFRVQLITACDQLCDKLCKLCFFTLFNDVFKNIFGGLQTAIELCQVAHQCRQFHAPEQKVKRNQRRLNQWLIQTAPLADECIAGLQGRPILVLVESSPPVLAPSTPRTPALEEPTSKTVSQPPKAAEDRSSDSDTPIRQVSPLLGTTKRKNYQLQNRNTPDDISNVLGTCIFQGYVEMPLQTLDGIVVNQPKRFLPLAEEAKHLAEEIRIEKLNKQWAGIPREQLLHQSFTNQLNSNQILEQLAPLQLAKENLPVDIIDILEHLGKADNIPFNQLYYVAENCVD